MDPSTPETTANELVPVGRERFEVYACIGFGGSSVVYQAHDRLLATDVAIKVLGDGGGRSYDRFLSEALIGQQLNHPNIVRMHGMIQRFEGERPALVMELVKGESLKDRLSREGKLQRFEELLRIFRAVVEGLKHAHAHAVIHRDIKPSNVMLSLDGAVKLADFGIAHAQVIGSGATQTGEIVGSIGYIAPELLAGGIADARSDIYALGMLACELTNERSLNGVPSLRFPRQVPRWFAEVVSRCVSPDPNSRYASCNDLLCALERKRSGLSALGRVPQIVLGALLLILVSLVALTQSDPTFATAVARLAPILDRAGIDLLTIGNRLGLAIGDLHVLTGVAAKDGDLQFLRYLIEKRGVDRTSASVPQRWLLCAADSGARINVLRYLIVERGYSADVACSDKGSLLIPALTRLDTTLLKLLLDNGAAPPGRFTTTRRHPLLISIAGGHLPSFKLILAQPEFQKSRIENTLPLYEIVKHRRSANNLLATYLQSGVDLKARDGRGFTALHMASEDCNPGAVKLLADIGLSSNELSPEGVAPLHVLCERGREVGNMLQTLSILRSSGADINAADAKGVTPLMVAVLLGDHDFVDLLLSYPEINLTLRDGRGRDALDHALRLDRPEIILALMERVYDPLRRYPAIG